MRFGGGVRSASGSFNRVGNAPCVGVMKRVARWAHGETMVGMHRGRFGSGVRSVSGAFNRVGNAPCVGVVKRVARWAHG
ncbi:hypothetical protein K227x_07840 [Rubripirellula lacrimiformis]|uniref:Uncharacterized protein n=1 Tax=Rubripirellula lacrimiformis TaxID=1930273 RepID=A0A517N5W0_9BACT|nr:hypothetical protein K227x_07840 [Rubripirellula lacrimiformis]